MTNLGKFLIALALVLGAAGSILGVLHLNSASYGSTGQPSTVDPNPQWLSGGITVGQTGTFNTNSQFGICNPTFYGTSLAATSTGTFACAVPGVQAGDKIVGDLPQGENTTLGGFVITAAYATTSNIVAFTYLNLTGNATTSFPFATTSVEYFTWR